MKWFRLLILIFLVATLAVSYISYKKYIVKIAVKNYLEEVHILEEDIVELKPIITNLSGDRKWMVYVRLKNDPKGYHYYKHKGWSPIL